MSCHCVYKRLLCTEQVVKKPDKVSKGQLVKTTGLLELRLGNVFQVYLPSAQTRIISVGAGIDWKALLSLAPGLRLWALRRSSKITTPLHHHFANTADFYKLI